MNQTAKRALTESTRHICSLQKTDSRNCKVRLQQSERFKLKPSNKAKAKPPSPDCPRCSRCNRKPLITAPPAGATMEKTVARRDNRIIHAASLKYSAEQISFRMTMRLVTKPEP
uniref:Uncharacterized protein n=1 Tax=Steinernema glaseri TaxID=37863 RepID=A0A1I7ZR17_9BILA